MALIAETYILVQPDQLSSLNDIWGTTLALGLSTSNTSIIGIGSNNFKYYTQLTALDSNLDETSLGIFQYPPRPVDNSGFPIGYGAFSVSNPLRSFFNNDYGLSNIEDPQFIYGTIIPNYSSSLIHYKISSGFSYNPQLSVNGFETVLGSFSYLSFSFSTVSPFINFGFIYIVSDNPYIQGSHQIQNGSTYSIVTYTEFTSNMASATPLATITDYTQGDDGTLIENLYGFNAVIPYNLYQAGYDWLVVNGTINDYPLDNTNPQTTFKFLSNYPNRSEYLCSSGSYSCFGNAKRTRVGYYETIDCIIDTDLLASITNVFYITFDKNFEQIDFFSFDLSVYSICSSCGLNKVRLPVGWLNLINNFSIPDDVEYMAMFIGDEFGTSLYTELRYFRFDRECTIYEPIEFMFLNKLGGFDYFTFTQDSKEIHSISRNEYKKEANWGDVYSGSLGLGFRGKTVMSGNVEKTFSANTNWITETEYGFLSELVESPEVYIMKNFPPNGYSYTPVAILITDTSYEIKTSVRDSIFNLTINYKMAVDTPMQRQ